MVCLISWFDEMSGWPSPMVTGYRRTPILECRQPDKGGEY